MRECSNVTAFVVGTLALAAAIIACTGDDPALTPTDDAGADGSSGTSGTSGADGSSGTSGSVSLESCNVATNCANPATATCPALVEPTGMAAATQLHFDACNSPFPLGQTLHDVPDLTGKHTISGDANVCGQSEMKGGRSGIFFNADTDGLAVGGTPALDFTSAFVIYTVAFFKPLQPSGPNQVLFSAAKETAPNLYDGPGVLFNYTYAAAWNGTDLMPALGPTGMFAGAQARFGTAPGAGGQNAKASVAAQSYACGTHVFRVMSDTTKMTFWVDGQQNPDVIDLTGVVMNGGVLHIGNAKQGASQFFSGLIGEMVILSTADAMLADAVDKALRDRWSIP